MGIDTRRFSGPGVTDYVLDHKLETSIERGKTTIQISILCPRSHNSTLPDMSIYKSSLLDLIFRERERCVQLKVCSQRITPVTIS